MDCRTPPPPQANATALAAPLLSMSLSSPRPLSPAAPSSLCCACHCPRETPAAPTPAAATSAAAPAAPAASPQRTRAYSACARSSGRRPRRKLTASCWLRACGTNTEKQRSAKERLARVPRSVGLCRRGQAAYGSTNQVRALTPMKRMCLGLNRCNQCAPEQLQSRVHTCCGCGHEPRR